MMIYQSKFPVPTVTCADSVRDWAKDINEQLKWNQMPVPAKD